MALQLLFDGRLAPLTSEIGFIECDPDTAVAAFTAWMGPIQAKRGVTLNRSEVGGNLESRLRSLLPLNNIERRRQLFLPTASRWTAYIDNGWRGTDAYSTMSQLARLVKCRALRVVCNPHTLRKTPDGFRGNYGAVMLAIYSAIPPAGEILNTERAIAAANDGGRWVFETSGDPLPFENVEAYKLPRIRDRFTPEMLNAYLNHLGVDAFEERFYNVDAPALLISKSGPHADGMKEYSLEEARAKY